MVHNLQKPKVNASPKPQNESYLVMNDKLKKQMLTFAAVAQRVELVDWWSEGQRERENKREGW